jgi:uncharacterized protein (TIGR02099 family)
MRHTSKLKTFAWYSGVTLLVIFAVLVSLVRVTIGSVSEYRQHLEAAAGRYLGQPVSISGMDARLVGLRPTVLLDKVSLLEKDTREQIAQFRQIAISLNPLSSLRQLQPIIDLSIHGAHIVLGVGEDGAFRVQGVSLSQEARNEGSGGALGVWFLSQTRLALLDSKVVWRDFETGDETVFSGVNLELQNLQERHRLSADVKLPKEVGKALRLSLDIRGNLLNRKDWQGDLYLKAERLHPAPWLEPFDYKGLRLQQGQVDVELWSSWEGGLLRGVEGEFDLVDLALRDDSDTQSLKRLAGRLRYVATDEGWRLQVGKLLLQPDEEQVEPLTVELSHDDEQTVVQATALPLALVQRYGPYLPQLNKSQREWLRHASPDGWIRDIHLVLAQDKVRAVAVVKALQLEPWRRYPGVKGLSGHLSVDWPQAVMVLDSEQMAVALPRLFRQPLPIDRATGVVRMQKEGEQWRVAATTMQLTTPDISADLAFDGWLSPGEAPLLSLSAKVVDGKVASVPRYLPAHIMSKGSVDWLDHAFAGGEVGSGAVLIHGRLNTFPFYGRQGRFEVVLDTKDVKLHYQDNWPELQSVAGEVIFNGGGMSIEARRAKVFGARLRKTRVAIDNFRQPMLKVVGVADASVNDALRFLRASPLAKTAGKALEGMQGEGKTRIDLDLAIPLTDTVAKASPLAVKGSVAFQECSLQVAKGVSLGELQGVLSFSDQQFEATGITANLYGEPASINVFSPQDNGHVKGTVIAAQGRAQAEALQQAFDLPLVRRLDGVTDWQAQLSLERGESGSSLLAIHSSLEGMAVDLPQPAAKPHNGVRPFSLDWQIGGKGLHTHRLSYGELINAVWQYESEAYHLRRAGLIFGGKGKAELPQQAMIHIGGRLEQLTPRDWIVLREELGKKEGAKSIELPPIELVMERLQLLSADAEEEEQASGADAEALRAADVPSVTVNVNSFSYGDMNLGRLAAKVKPQEKAVLFEALSLNSRNFSMTGKGRWDEGGSTRFTAELEANNFGRMMRGLGFSSIINDGKTHANGTFSWPGNPTDFSLQHLGGEVHTTIEEGVIEEVDPGAGKLLGLLSLQALPRRLFLDFSDLSGKGLQFDSIEGDFRFAEGNAFTQNLHLKSLPANVLVTGRTGLVQKDFDQLIAVVPNVSDTVSVAGALAWGPQAAAVLLVLQKLFQSDIDAATMISYELTGSWDKPKLSKLEQLEPVEPLPPE